MIPLNKGVGHICLIVYLISSEEWLKEENGKGDDFNVMNILHLRHTLENVLLALIGVQSTS